VVGTEGTERDRKNVHTVAVTVMCHHFLAYCDRLDHAEGDITPLAKDLTVIVAVVLSLFPRKDKEQENVS
jgi:hypothetical protein